jgi:hypothetical protein
MRSPAYSTPAIPIGGCEGKKYFAQLQCGQPRMGVSSNAKHQAEL